MKLYPVGCSVSPSLWCERLDGSLMDDGSERDKRKGWHEGTLIRMQHESREVIPCPVAESICCQSQQRQTGKLSLICFFSSNKMIKQQQHRGGISSKLDD